MRFVIVSKIYGAYIGSMNNLAIFAKRNDIGAYKLASFSSVTTAKEYVNNYLSFEDNSDEDYFYVMVETNEKYISCVEMIRLGYQNEIGTMVLNLPTPSVALH
jgi:hypothetical protein